MLWKDMGSDAKINVTSWWILALMALFLWYRNEKYDRALAIFVFTLGLVQLIEYGVRSGADPHQSGRALFITLWLQCLVLAIGVFIFIDGAQRSTATENIAHTIAGWNLFLFATIFVIALIFSFTSDSSFSGLPNASGGVEWHMNGTSLLNKWGWLYLLGIFIPLFLIFAFYVWADIGIAVLIIYGVLAAAFVLAHYPVSAFTNLWCYLAVGFAFLAWFMGIIPAVETKHGF
jgi:hypothetical protein